MQIAVEGLRSIFNTCTQISNDNGDKMKTLPNRKPP